MKRREVPNEVLLDHVRRLVAEGHTATIRVKGHSMRPLLEGGRDQVSLAPYDALKRGDVVLAEIAPRGYVLHRIIRIEGECLTLMGDGNVRGVETCNRENVVAVATTIIRNGKRITIAGRGQRMYAFLWDVFRPARRGLLSIYGRICIQ